MTISRPAGALLGAGVLLVAVSGCASRDGAEPSRTPDASDSPSSSGTPSPGGTPSGAPSTPGAPGSSPDPSSTVDPAAVGGQWTLIALTDATGTVQKPLPAPTIDLRASGTMRGNGGCNLYTASYTTSPALTIGDVVSTQMFCERSSPTEQRYFAALRGVDAVSASAAKLTLSGPGVSLVFSADPARSTMG